MATVTATATATATTVSDGGGGGGGGRAVLMLLAWASVQAMAMGAVPSTANQTSKNTNLEETLNIGRAAPGNGIRGTLPNKRTVYSDGNPESGTLPLVIDYLEGDIFLDTEKSANGDVNGLLDAHHNATDELSQQQGNDKGLLPDGAAPPDAEGIAEEELLRRDNAFPYGKTLPDVDEKQEGERLSGSDSLPDAHVPPEEDDFPDEVLSLWQLRLFVLPLGVVAGAALHIQCMRCVKRHRRRHQQAKERQSILLRRLPNWRMDIDDD